MSLFVPVPQNHILTSGANSALTWTNAVSVSSMNVSSLGASALAVSTLTTSSSVNASTLTTGLLNYSSLVGSSISTNAMTLSLVNTSTQNTQIYQVATTNPTTSYTAIQASHVSTGTTNNALVLNPSGGNVGVGETAPSQLLSLFGTGTPAMLIKSNSGGTSGNTASIYLSNAAYNMGTIQAIENANGYNGTWGSELTFATNFNNTMTERMRITARGNVGIGTTTPAAALEVTANSSGQPYGIMYVNANNTLSTTVNSYDILQQWNETPGSNNSMVNLLWNRTSAGSDWMTASQRLQARTDVVWQGFIEFNGTNNNYGVTIGAGSSASNPNSVPSVMTIKNGGNVGIGTTAPSSKLEILGGAIHASATSKATVAVSGDNGVFGSIEAFAVGNGASKLPLALNPYGGNVGIGMTAPTASLHVLNPTPQAGNTAMVTAQIIGRPATGGVQNGMSGGFAIGAANAGANSVSRFDVMAAGVSGTGNNWGYTPDVTVATFLGNGNVGIGTTAPAHPLSVGSTYGIMTSATFTLAGSSSVNTGYTLPPGGLYQVTVTTNSPNGPGGGNSHWWWFGLVNFNNASFIGFPIIINNNNVSISVATNGQVTVSTPGGSGSFSWIISAVRLC